MYVGNLDWSVTQQNLTDMFQTINGLKDTRLVCDFMERSKGYAYLDYETPEQVREAAEKYNGHEIHGRPMKVAPSKPTKQLYDEKIVFVKLVPDSATEDMIREYFAECGNVVGVQVPTDARNKRKGHAYVEFDDDGAVKKALQLSNVKELIKNLERFF